MTVKFSPKIKENISYKLSIYSKENSSSTTQNNSQQNTSPPPWKTNISITTLTKSVTALHSNYAEMPLQQALE